MFNKIVEFLFCADIIKTPKVFCLTFGVHITFAVIRRQTPFVTLTV